MLLASFIWKIQKKLSLKKDRKVEGSVLQLSDFISVIIQSGLLAIVSVFIVKKLDRVLENQQTQSVEIAEIKKDVHNINEKSDDSQRRISQLEAKVSTLEVGFGRLDSKIN